MRGTSGRGIAQQRSSSLRLTSDLSSGAPSTGGIGQRVSSKLLRALTIGLLIVGASFENAAFGNGAEEHGEFDHFGHFHEDHEQDTRHAGDSHSSNVRGRSKSESKVNDQGGASSAQATQSQHSQSSRARNYLVQRYRRDHPRSVSPSSAAPTHVVASIEGAGGKDGEHSTVEPKSPLFRFAEQTIPGLEVGATQSLIEKQFQQAVTLNSSKNLSLPNFPRLWHSETGASWHDFTVNRQIGLSKGLPLGLTGISFKLKNDYTVNYQVSATVMLVSSINPGTVDREAKGEYLPATGPHVASLAGQSFLKLDPVTLTNKLVRISGHPVLAYCHYEVSQAHIKSRSFEYSLLGYGLTDNHSDGHRSAAAVYSNVWEVPENETLSPQEMVEEVCQGSFLDSVKEYLENTVRNASIEYMAHHRSGVSPYAFEVACMPPHNHRIFPKGDPGCLEWFEESRYRNFGVDGAVDASSYLVPRCIKSPDKHHYCTLRAVLTKDATQGDPSQKSWLGCPMYWDFKQNKMVPGVELTAYQKFTMPRATNSLVEYDCDEANGYECQALRDPTFFFGTNRIIFPGSSHCVRKTR